MGKIQQAVVIVHGMGEQRPQQTLQGFIDAAVPRRGEGDHYYSEPERVSGSFESRLYRVPASKDSAVDVETDFYEYHWAHLMQGNRLGDLGPMFRRMLLRWPWRVPAGLRPAWVIFWVAGLALGWALAFGPLRGAPLGDDKLTGVIQGLLGAGLTSTVLVYVITKVLPGPLTVSFVDVVRYLDTSPRSYAVRREVRKGMVDLLRGLHEVRDGDEPGSRYDRIVVVAHSLGAYVAYDGISYLWSQCGTMLGSTPWVSHGSAALDAVEKLADDLKRNPTPATVVAYQSAQRALWSELAQNGSPWLVTDFISVGTPMYGADALYTKTRLEWARRVARRELPTCPPQSDRAERNKGQHDHFFSFRDRNRRYIYHAAPFALVRWTNLWFPSRFGLFGDWFGGPLAPLFGPGVRDVSVTARGMRWVPALAHTKYFSYPKDEGPDSPTTALRAALDLASTAWLRPPSAPKRPRSSRGRATPETRSLRAGSTASE
jgi:hypothetical protein